MTIPSEFERRYEEAKRLVRTTGDDAERKRLMAAHVYPSDSVDVALMKLEYRLDNGKDLDFDNPTDFSAKLHWLKRHDRRPFYGIIADRYAVREYVSERGQRHILNRCHGVFVDPMEIDDAMLPDKFVIKGTHGRNMSIVCTDNETFDWTSCRNELGRWLCTRYEDCHGEWAYSLPTPRLMIEEFLQDDEHNQLPGYELYCFGGIPKFVMAKTHAPTHRCHGFFTPDWRPLPFRYHDMPSVHAKAERPVLLQEMLTIAERLSQSLPFVRVDLCAWRGEVRFNGLTLYPRGGNARLVPEAWHSQVGAMLSLPVDEAMSARIDGTRAPQRFGI